MPSSHPIGVILAIASAASWGTGDLCGGVASRRAAVFQVVALASLTGIVLIAVLALARGETFPDAAGVMWSLLAGLVGFVGLAALYAGLSRGSASIVAPTAGVVGAIVPVLFGAIRDGLPGAFAIGGFAVGVAGIWLVTRSSRGRAAIDSGLALAVLAGTGFGGFYVLITFAGPNLFFTPALIAKSVTFAAAVAILALRRQSLPSPLANPIALAAGALDSGGNILYLMAKEFTRLDIAAVLSSMYPAATVLLAAVLLRDRVSRTQWAGLALCLCALALIAL
jgi:drug/metabolite transporter (DMT)-like permease